MVIHRVNECHEQYHPQSRREREQGHGMIKSLEECLPCWNKYFHWTNSRCWWMHRSSEDLLFSDGLNWHHSYWLQLITVQDMLDRMFAKDGEGRSMAVQIERGERIYFHFEECGTKCWPLINNFQEFDFRIFSRKTTWLTMGTDNTLERNRSIVDRPSSSRCTAHFFPFRIGKFLHQIGWKKIFQSKWKKKKHVRSEIERSLILLNIFELSCIITESNTIYTSS